MKKTSVLAILAAMMVSGGAYAADLQIPAQVDKAVAYATSGWDGLYVGVNAGYGWANRNGNWDTPFFGGGTPVPFNYDLGGGMIGAQAGFNYTLTNNFLVGVELSADAANITGTLDPTGIDAGQGTINWLTMATAKLGYSTDRFLVYVDAGYALSGFNFNGDLGCNFSQTTGGFTAGIGGSVKLTDRVSADLSYNHIWNQDANAACTVNLGGFGAPFAVHTASGEDIVKVGLNYQFGN